MMNKNSKNILIVVIFSVLLSGCSKLERRAENDLQTTNNIVSQETAVILEENENLEVCYLDVGEADCQIIQLPNGQNMMIDAGDKNDVEAIKEYLELENIRYIDYVVSTHPHSDHIGGMSEVFDNYEVGTVYMPDVITDTEAFKELMIAINENQIPICIAEAGIEIVRTSDFCVEFISPTKDEYNNLNNFSTVVKITYNDTVFFIYGRC